MWVGFEMWTTIHAVERDLAAVRANERTRLGLPVGWELGRPGWLRSLALRLRRARHDPAEGSVLRLPCNPHRAWRCRECGVHLGSRPRYAPLNRYGRRCRRRSWRAGANRVSDGHD
jgi:hypothetical protein